MQIVALSYIALAIFVGYAITVALTMAATFGITLASPAFVAKENRIQTSYKYTQDALWLVCTTVGGYAAAMINGRTYAYIVGPGLALILIAVLWINAWEMRQRGLGHQFLMSLAAAAGVFFGFFLRLN
jgi:hypothetical protein